MISKQEGVIDNVFDEREERMREFHKNLDEAQREQEKKDEENGAVFFIAGQKIVLSEDYICIKDIVIEARKLLCGNQERFQNNIYGKNIDFKQLMSQADYIQTSYETTVEKLRRLALKHGVKCAPDQILWDINRESGTIWLKSLDDINIIYQEKQKLDDQLQNIDGLLELQKQTRNRVRGYGSGLKGLLKTSIQTSLINAGIGGAYELRNSIKMHSLEKKCQETLNEFANRSEIKDRLVQDYKYDMNCLLRSYIMAICKAKDCIQPFVSWDDADSEATKIKDKAKQMPNLERAKEYAFLLNAFPWNVSVYTDVYNLYPDSHDELAKYARFFEVDIVDKLIENELRAERQKEAQCKAEIQKAEREKKEEQKRLIREREDVIRKKKLIDQRLELEKKYFEDEIEIPETVISEYNRMDEGVNKYKLEYEDALKKYNDALNEANSTQVTILNLKRNLQTLGIFDLKKKNEIKNELSRLDKEDKEKTSFAEICSRNANELNTKLKLEVQKRDKYINDYKNAQREMQKSALFAYYHEHMPSFSVTDNMNYVTFGKTKWLIIGWKNSRMFLLADLLIPEDISYEKTGKKDVTWSTCSLREWLNNDYYTTQFSKEEQRIIEKRTLEESRDKVFVLSEQEVLSRLKTEGSRICGTKRYQPPQNRYIDNCSWWLRSSGEARRTTSIVTSDGRILNNHSVTNSVNYVQKYVRPAIVIDFSLLYKDNKVMHKYQEFFGENKEFDQEPL